MTTTEPTPQRSVRVPDLDLPSVYRPLPRWAPYAIGAGAVVAAFALRAVLGSGKILTAVFAALLFVLVLSVVSRSVEGQRRSADRTVTCVVVGSFLIAMVPLVSLLYTVISRGYHRIDGAFFTDTMRNVVGAGGGAKHAMIGTLIITGLTALIAVPIGLLTSIYLVEYGSGRLASTITFLVDIMIGIPSIVAGLFAYALFVLLVGPGVRFGIGGAVALSVLMIPVVVRSAEEMLKLVPAELREASYALGVPKWRTILKVVLPVAAAGIATGVTLAVARVIGETAPLLLIVGTTSSLNTDPFHDRMQTLPVYIYYSLTQPGLPVQASLDRAWTAALVLMLIVVLLNVAARAISRFFSPSSR